MSDSLFLMAIQALSEIDRELGLPNDGCNSTAQTILEIRSLKARAASVEHDPACDACHGVGEYFGHSSDCNDDLCALNGDQHSCVGQVEKCNCVKPAQAEGVSVVNYDPCEEIRRQHAELPLYEEAGDALVAERLEWESAHVVSPGAWYGNPKSALENRFRIAGQIMRLRGIKSRFDHSATPQNPGEQS